MASTKPKNCLPTQKITLLVLYSVISTESILYHFINCEEFNKGRLLQAIFCFVVILANTLGHIAVSKFYSQKISTVIEIGHYAIYGLALTFSNPVFSGSEQEVSFV
jgi:hypothetical protein